MHERTQRVAAADAVDPALVPQRRLYTGAMMPAIGLGTFGSDHIPIMLSQKPSKRQPRLAIAILIAHRSMGMKRISAIRSVNSSLLGWIVKRFG